MKIKRKVEMNLPQLIEYAWENDIRSRQIRADQDISAVFINKFGDVYITDDVKRDDTFTVEVEEEINESTVIPKMLVVGRFDGYEEVYNQKLINFTQHLLSAYIIQDDGHMELIYDEEKGLVE